MLPVTAEIKEILDKLDMKSDVPFVRQLQLQEPWIVGRSFRRNLKNKPSVDVQFRKLLKEAGITRPLRPHDLRRTTAVAMYKASKDVRDVQALLGHRSMQSTIWYLDHDLKPIDRKMLETIKRPFIAWRREQSA
jgi:integrase